MQLKMNANELHNLVKQFNIAKTLNYSHKKLNEIAEEIQKNNMFAYGIQTPFVFRRNKITEVELKKWERLQKYIKPEKHIKLFDTAFGSGRDLLLAKKFGYNAYGCELSEFLYTDFLIKSNFESTKVIHADFCNIPFPDKMFDVIRHNASFLHMPLIGPGYTVHKCLDESFRLLKENGYLYIYTKEGTGFVALDTLDGLGLRSFQLYDEETLGSILADCGFTVKCFNHYDHMRNGKHILWIEVFAQKVTSAPFVRTCSK